MKRMAWMDKQADSHDACRVSLLLEIEIASFSARQLCGYGSAVYMHVTKRRDDQAKLKY